nr:MAG TPA: hypothetical protein [Crassvirales sp.]DAL02302.1 MAG TPA: hypothetical protein [Caudoviricetes sp.]
MSNINRRYLNIPFIFLIIRITFYYSMSRNR